MSIHLALKSGLSSVELYFYASTRLPFDPLFLHVDLHVAPPFLMFTNQIALGTVLCILCTTYMSWGGM